MGGSVSLFMPPPVTTSPVSLVIDDDEVSVRAASHVLRYAGWRVVGLSDPRKVLEAVRREQPVVVLVDLSMPHLDGRELIALLRSELGADVPRLVLITGSVDREAVARELGIPSVGKPYLPGELLDAVAQALGRPDAPLITTAMLEHPGTVVES